MTDRKGFLTKIMATGGSLVAPFVRTEARTRASVPFLKPPRVRPGQTAAIVSRDSERLNDLHEAFADPDVKIVFPIRGGYGSSRLLPLVDFDLIRDRFEPLGMQVRIDAGAGTLRSAESAVA